jgi:8-hydroxy-5-deazaflavin:NADPH oxidoreductase
MMRHPTSAAAMAREPRRALVVLALLAALASTQLAALRPASAAEHAPSQNLKIGIIGTGRIGGTLARLWVKAGYEVMMSSRHPSQLLPLQRSLGPRAHVGTPRAAASFGSVVLVSVPYGALPEVGRDYARELAGKVVIDTGNPYPERDGAMAEEARRKGTGVASAQFLPGVRLARAFNAISYKDLAEQVHVGGQPAAIPVAADDPDALAVAQRLVRAAGFEPVVVGGLARAREFDVGTAVYVKLMTAADLRRQLGLDASAAPAAPGH